MNNSCEVKVLTSNRAPTTHCYWWDATVRTVASTQKEQTMDDGDRDMLIALGYGQVNRDDDDEKASDEFDDVFTSFTQ